MLYSYHYSSLFSSTTTATAFTAALLCLIWECKSATVVVASDRISQWCFAASTQWFPWNPLIFAEACRVILTSFFPCSTQQSCHSLLHASWDTEEPHTFAGRSVMLLRPCRQQPHKSSHNWNQNRILPRVQQWRITKPNPVPYVFHMHLHVSSSST